MNYRKLLPLGEYKSVKEWQEKWLHEVCSEVFSSTEWTENSSMLRQRNERFSSFLPTLTTLMGAHREHIAVLKEKYEDENPRPTEKGITAWKEGEKAYTREFVDDLTFIEQLHTDVSTRVSVTQTNLRTLVDEVKRV